MEGVEARGIVIMRDASPVLSGNASLLRLYAFLELDPAAFGAPAFGTTPAEGGGTAPEPGPNLFWAIFDPQGLRPYVDLTDPDEATVNALNLKCARELTDRKVIRHALARSEGNISSSAKLLGISRPTLYDLLKQYDLQT